MIAGKKTPDEALTEFMAQWETDKADGTITRDEFLDYYKGGCGGGPRACHCVCAGCVGRVCVPWLLPPGTLPSTLE